MIETARNIILCGERKLISVNQADMYELRINEQCYAVPAGVAALIGKLIDEISMLQDTRMADEKTVERKINNRINSMIRVMGPCGLGPNLFKMDLDTPVDPPEGVELDEEYTFRDYVRERAKKGLLIHTGNLMEEFDPIRLE